MGKPLIQRAWLGPKEIPNDYVQFGREWQELNPDWEVVDWSLEMVEAKRWRNQSVIDDIRRRGGNSIEAAVQIADVIGYELIWEFGGLYINVDIEPLKSMKYFIEYYKPGNTAYAGREDWNTDRIVNSVMGGPSKHPFWNFVIQSLPARYWMNPEAEMVLTTGPALLTECAHYWQRGKDRDHEFDFTEIARAAFNAVHWSQIPPGQNADGRFVESEEMIGVHHWGHRLTGRSNLVRKPIG